MLVEIRYKTVLGLRQSIIRVEEIMAYSKRFELLEVNPIKKVYAALYNPMYHESAFATLSVHFTKEGAEKAIEEHEQKEKEEAQPFIDRQIEVWSKLNDGEFLNEDGELKEEVMENILKTHGHDAFAIWRVEEIEIEE